MREISAGAGARDRDPAFPEEPFGLLARGGFLALPLPGGASSSNGLSGNGLFGDGPSFAGEWRVLREVARADGSVGRVLDGHLNGVERVLLLAPEPLRSREIESIGAGELRLGVWGADPVPGEGEPARLVRRSGEIRLSGVKTFCSGAGGLDRALVAVRGEGGRPGPPHLAYVDLTDRSGYKVDRTWYRSSGMRSSESHRVVFDGARVLAVLGEPGELVREPYFSRDAIRTAASWAGISDLARDAALETLAAKSGPGGPDDLASLAAGRMIAHSETMDRWLQDASDRADNGPRRLAGAYAVALRQSVASACRALLDEAVRACGSHPFATAGPLDRAKRDLELILLQHRLEPALAKTGRRAIEETGSGGR
ncbi:acyl-CoA dehydrogenase family protein [Rubrobacter indicoceani]|uniref:acyl-CoA dehydrogenase family protein n=1 Tax=Rubrobacter indicoceani TaxID=2051957 RepID=UPI0013C4DCD1|nr:acyl-CoA dehydrogenase family protein [Rubrobacter indicoceani]